MSEGPSGIEPPEFLRGAKRANLRKSEWLPDWWVGYGKDESCQFEGTWFDMVCFAAKILAEPATELVAPNLYRPELAEAMTEAQQKNYTGGPSPGWPSDAKDEPANA